MVLIEGFGGARNYYKEGLDKFGIDVHVFRVGEYKSPVEPYLRDDMSKEAKEMSLDTYGDLWRDWLADVGEARKIAPADIAAGIEALPIGCARPTATWRCSPRRRSSSTRSRRATRSGSA
jgi:protease-4